MIGVTVQQMTKDNFYGNLQPFGDLRVVPMEYAFAYYRLNAYQRDNIKWIENNHLIMFANHYRVRAEDYRCLLTVARIGFTKIVQLVVVNSVIVRPVADKLQLQIAESRLISIGKRGGLRLVNPKRRGTIPHGKYVLIAEPDFTIMPKPIFDSTLDNT